MNFDVLKRELPKIGRVKLVISNYSQYSSRYDAVLRGEVPNVFNPEYAGGCLMDITLTVTEILEKTRKAAGILFPGD